MNGFDWRATPETAQMFGPQGVFAPFYARRQQQLALLTQQQQREFEEKQQRAAFDYASALTKLRANLEAMAPDVQARTREAKFGLKQMETVADDVALTGQAMEEAIQAGDYDKAEQLRQSFILRRMPQQYQAPQAQENQYFFTPEGLQGPFPTGTKTAGWTGGAGAAAGAITPSVAERAQRESIEILAGPPSTKDVKVESRVVRDVLSGKKIGRPKVRGFLQMFAGPWTQQKQNLFDEIVRERNARMLRGEEVQSETEDLIENIRNLLYYGRVIAGTEQAPAPRLGGRHAPGFGAGGEY